MIWELAEGRRIDFRQRVQIMGVLNVTPDSFYDGGRYADGSAAVDRALSLVEAGADIVDVGGESTRPLLYGQAEEVPAAEEERRVLPVIEAIRKRSDVPISVDTVKAGVARQALDAGADIVNDISALSHDVEMARVAAEAGAPVILMHRRGTPATMQQDTHYDDLTGEVAAYLEERVEYASGQGIPPSRVAVDPGIGFGKSFTGNHELLRRAGSFSVRGCPVVVGASRKSFLWKPMGLTPDEALETSLAAAVLAVLHGARALRVHDVRETVRAVRVSEAAVVVP